MPGSPLSVVLVTGTTGWRGSSASFAKIAEGLRAAGHGAHLVAGGAPLADRFRALGLPTTELPLADTGPREVWALRSIFRTARATAVLADTPRDLRVSLYAGLFRLPVVYRYNLNYRRPRTDLGDRFYLSAAAGFVYQSAYIQAEAERYQPRLVRRRHWRVPNGYDLHGALRPRPEAGARLRTRLGLPDDVPIVLTGSHFGEGKGHDVAFEALARLVRAGRRLAYVLPGAGLRETHLRRLAGTFGVPAYFLGFVEPTEIPEVVAGADLVVHPGATEIFPNAVAEAMALGRALVAGDAGGTPEVVGREGAGCLLPPDDVDAWARAIDALLGDPARRAAMGAAARARIAREFPLARMHQGYLDLFAAVTRRRSRPMSGLEAILRMTRRSIRIE